MISTTASTKHGVCARLLHSSFIQCTTSNITL